MNLEKLENFRGKIEIEWRENISPFWIKYVPDENYGGFHGFISNNLQVDEFAGRGIVLNSRILWTFPRTFQVFRDERYLKIPKRAFEYLSEIFFDKENGE